MSEAEANTIKNVWELSIARRWQLYKFWLQLYIESKQVETLEMQQQFRDQYKELNELKSLQDAYLCQRADIVGMTTTGAAKYKHIIEFLNPRVVIVEEAAEILESHIVTSLAPKTQHVILIGDHQQLRPSSTVHMLSVKYGLNVSLFERMIKNGMECQQLRIQHRMRPDIASLLVPHIYKNLENHESVLAYENIKGIGKSVFFLSHNYLEVQECDSKSKVNQHEAQFLIQLCNYLILQDYEPSQITILTTYSGQLFEIKRLAKGILEGVRITVVDNFQGEENDIILISFVRSNEEGEIGFLKVSNRICVALSRAKKGLYCIGNFQVLSQNSSMWNKITSTLKETGSIGESLELRCQNHPSTITCVAREKDFESVQDGGCNLICEYRLECGHSCPKKCHPANLEHDQIICLKNCNKTCPKEHLCKKQCYQDCGKCMIPVLTKVRTCGHEIEVACYLTEEQIKCPIICKKSLPCGHEINTECYWKKEDIKCIEKCNRLLVCGHICPNTCREKCATKCEILCKFMSTICNHELNGQCFRRNDVQYLSKNCSSPCSDKLTCQHTCKGTCNTCHQRRLHVECNKKCMKILVCGHECQSICSKSCPPCNKKCENWCVHGKCTKICCEICDVCTEPCEWVCQHKRCTQFCGELCDRTPCDEACSKTLQCGHSCLGFCGEPCPELCKVCDSGEETIIKMENTIQEKYVLLEDCGHVFESGYLSQALNKTNLNYKDINMLNCPKCGLVIQKNFRFGNSIKNYKQDLRKVKIKKETYYQTVISSSFDINIFLEKELKNNMYIKSEYPSLISALRSNRHKSHENICIMKNFISIILVFNEISRNMKILGTYNYLKVKKSNLFSYMEDTISWITPILRDDYLTTSNQRMNEICWEVFRLKLLSQILLNIKNRPFSKPSERSTFSMMKPFLKKCVISVFSYKPFREEDLLKLSSVLKKITDEESTLLNRLKILSPKSLFIYELDLKKICLCSVANWSLSDWLKCKSGHVYCATDDEAVCNDCAIPA